ncbi:MAG: hypothetical protein ACK482_10965, partial [Aphanizomenon sp.]
FGQEIINRFAANSRVPIVNGLTNEHHPCQVFAAVFTYIEHRGSIAGKTVAWVGDANNMLYSWLQAAEVFGFWDFNNYLATPFGLVTGLAWGLFTMPLLHQKMRIKQVLYLHK